MESIEIRVSVPVDDAFRWPAGRLTVLLVAADQELRAAAARVIRSAGYHVVTAAHSGHALLACRAQGRIDVLVTDYSLGDTSGPALVERLRRHQPGLQAIYVAEHGLPSAGVLIRPFTGGDLVGRIASLLSPATSEA